MNRKSRFTACAALTVAGPLANAWPCVQPVSPDRTYSPYPEQTFPISVYFGDTHLHTGPEVPMTVTERTCTSPIWYTP